MNKLESAKRDVAATIASLDRDQQEKISKAVAKLCVAAVLDDRQRRRVIEPSTLGLVKLFDVFFNGRPA